jgi:hypothetical protein
MPTTATATATTPTRYSYVLVNSGPRRVDLFKVWTGGGSVHLAEFASRSEALAFVRSLPVARVVTL